MSLVHCNPLCSAHEPVSHLLHDWGAQGHGYHTQEGSAKDEGGQSPWLYKTQKRAWEPQRCVCRKVHDKVRIEENYFSGASFDKRIGRLKVWQRRKKMEKQVVLNWITR